MTVKLLLTDQSKQNPNPNNVMTTGYKGSRNVQIPLYPTLMGLDTVHGPKANNRRRNTKIDSRRPIVLTILIASK
jgi:hypothetical protein